MIEELGRGRWITFHRSPVYGPECTKSCSSSDGHRGYAALGQVLGAAAELFGRPAFEVAYWHEAKAGDLNQLVTTVPMDRIIGVLPSAPPGVKSFPGMEHEVPLTSDVGERP